MTLHKVYIASGLENAPEVQKLRDALALRGISIAYDPDLHEYPQDDGEKRATEIAHAKTEAVKASSLLIAFLPNGRDTHAEIGIALGAGVPVILSFTKISDLDDTTGLLCAFYHHRLVQWYARKDPDNLAEVVHRRLTMYPLPTPTVAATGAEEPRAGRRPSGRAQYEDAQLVADSERAPRHGTEIEYGSRMDDDFDDDFEDDDFDEDDDYLEAEELDDRTTCLFPHRCCMAGIHMSDECHTAEMAENAQRPDAPATLADLIAETRRINIANGWREPVDSRSALLVALSAGYLVEMTEKVEAVRDGQSFDEAAALAKARDVCSKIVGLDYEGRQAVADAVLLATEVMEKIEGILQPEPSEHCPELTVEEEEAADVAIRNFEQSDKRGIDLERAIRIKLAYNAKRGFRHGGASGKGKAI